MVVEDTLGRGVFSDPCERLWRALQSAAAQGSYWICSGLQWGCSAPYWCLTFPAPRLLPRDREGGGFGGSKQHPPLQAAAALCPKHEALIDRWTRRVLSIYLLGWSVAKRQDPLGGCGASRSARHISRRGCSHQRTSG